MSMDISRITEMNANYGKAGIFIGLFRIGLFLGLLDRIANMPRSTIAGVAIISGVLLSLFYDGSDFNLVTSSLSPQLLCFWIFFFAVQPIFGRLRGFIHL